jgi:hypothetical protein
MDSVGIAFDGTDLRRLHYSGIYQGSAAVTNVTFLLKLELLAVELLQFTE